MRSGLDQVRIGLAKKEKKKNKEEVVSLAERYAQGKGIRKKVPRESHGAWKPSSDRRDPVDLLIESSQGRVPELVPIRYGRMLQSPFAFYRGAAAIMAADLARTNASGIRVQACGDCHLLNFGGFATPERRVLFDINDFDETAPAPWEWDVKRLAASFVVAGRNSGFSTKEGRRAARQAVRSYRKRMAEFAAMPVLEVWYARIDVEKAIASVTGTGRRAFARKRLERATARNVAEDDFPKLVEMKKGRPVIKGNPPLIFHVQEQSQHDFADRVRRALERYRQSPPDDRRQLLDHYKLVDLAAKVVGVGSVGTRCAVGFFMASESDALFLQFKEARVSVLEPYAGASAYSNQGQRVVMGQRLMQSASDIFLGWTEMDRSHFYVRQLRDMKLKPLVETFDPEMLVDYAGLCGWALARAHAKSGDAERISGYLGKSTAFEDAIADFSRAYADQNDRDYVALKAAVASGRLEARTEA